MLFSSASYAVFLGCAYTLFWALRRLHRARTRVLILASYIFYVLGTYEEAVLRQQDPPFGPVRWGLLCLGIIFVGSSLDYGIGRAMGRIQGKKRRLLLLLVSIVYYLGVLALFKYWNFALDNLSWLAAHLGHPIAVHHVRLILPFGISFFTFETMSYTIDVYRKEIAPAKSYGEYLLFVAFFPHLVAGPIVRPQQLLPQLAKDPPFDPEGQMRGLFRIGVGLFKKVVIGDFLAVNLVGRVFNNPEHYSSVEVLVGVYAYALQIYTDFSGYSDVAIGSAQLFGYQIPENFDAPYLSRNLQDFWRRWHISLSSWLRDYLYIPLGGSKKGSLATYKNLLITMLLGGLWHGASWNFVIWGALHGGALAAVRVWQRWKERRFGIQPASTFGVALGMFVTFHYVCFAWVFFRARDFGYAAAVLAQIGKFSVGAVNLDWRIGVVMAIGLISHAIPRRTYEFLRERFALSPVVVQGAVMAGAAILLHLVAGAKEQPFIYGQF